MVVRYARLSTPPPGGPVPEEQPAPSHRRHRERRRGRASGQGGSSRGRAASGPDRGAGAAVAGVGPEGASPADLAAPAQAAAEGPFTASAPLAAGTDVGAGGAEPEGSLGEADPAEDAAPNGAGDAAPGSQTGRRPGARAAARQRPTEPDRGLRGLVGAGPSQVGPLGAMRARDAARPRPEDLEAAERDLVIVRRHYVPPDPP